MFLRFITSIRVFVFFTIFLNPHASTLGEVFLSRRDLENYLEDRYRHTIKGRLRVGEVAQQLRVCLLFQKT